MAVAFVSAVAGLDAAANTTDGVALPPSVPPSLTFAVFVVVLVVYIVILRVHMARAPKLVATHSTGILIKSKV